MNVNEVMAIVPQSELSLIKTELQLIKENLASKSEEAFFNQFIESKQVPKLLSISQRTWQSYRDKGEIPFIQFGQKVWVKRKDLEAFMDRYYITRK